MNNLTSRNLYKLFIRPRFLILVRVVFAAQPSIRLLNRRLICRLINYIPKPKTEFPQVRSKKRQIIEYGYELSNTLYRSMAEAHRTHSTRMSIEMAFAMVGIIFRLVQSPE